MRPKTLLVADDSATIRRIVELTFAGSDIRVEAVPDGWSALERLERVQPDLVLADVSMAEPSGYEICRRVKGSSRPVPVLLLAGTFEPLDLERARRCGADGHLVKPFDAAQLRERVETLLARGLPEAGNAAVEAVLQELASVEVAVEPAPVSASAPRSEAPSPPGESPLPLAEKPTLPAHAPLDEAALDAIARAVVERLSVGVLREIAWEVVPEVAERVIRERIRELERELDAEEPR